MSVFEEREKPDYQEENLSEQRREATTNSTHVWRRRQDFNPGQIGERRVLSPLRHQCSSWFRFMHWGEEEPLDYLRPMFIHTALAMRRRKSSGRRSKPKNWIGKGQLPGCRTPSTVWHGWADFFRISELCLQKSPYKLSWLCWLMKFVRHLLHNSKGVLCVRVKILSKTFITELTSNSYILVT